MMPITQNVIGVAAVATTQARQHHRDTASEVYRDETAQLLPAHDRHDRNDFRRRSSSHSSSPPDHYSGSLGSCHASRETLRHFLLSKYAHYLIITFVSLDITSIFADFLVSLHICEHTCGRKVIGDPTWLGFWEDVSEGLGIVGLIFSSLFMIELLLSIFAFGKSYFHSVFHFIDALSILTSFIVDVVERGTVAEAGSLIIALRLFRVFKIIEEGSTAAEELTSDMEERIQMLEQENEGLRRRLVGHLDHPLRV